MSLKKWREERASLIGEMENIKEQAKENDGGLMSPEQEERFDKLEADEARLFKNIQTEEKLERFRAEQAAKAAEQEEKKDTRTADEKRLQAFREYLRTGDVAEYRATQDGQSVGTDADGGYTVPQSWAEAIEVAMLAYGGMTEVATILNTSSGDQLNYPTLDNTSSKSSIAAEEFISTESKLTFATIALNAYTLRTSIIPISIELLQDSAYNFEQVIQTALAEEDARGLNYYCTVGTGTAQHNGVVTASTSGETAAATALTIDNLLDLKHSVDPAYRKNGRWMFNDATLKYIKKLTVGSSDDRPLWQPSLITGEPDTIDGDPYTINQDMADIGASAKSVLYGDFSKYVIRRVAGYSLVRFNEFYMRSLQIGLMGFSRSDGELIDAGTNPIKYIAHAAS